MCLESSDFINCYVPAKFFETQVAATAEFGGFPALPFPYCKVSVAVLKCYSLRITEETHTGKLVEPSGNDQAAVAH